MTRQQAARLAELHEAVVEARRKYDRIYGNAALDVFSAGYRDLLAAQAAFTEYLESLVEEK